MVVMLMLMTLKLVLLLQEHWRPHGTSCPTHSPAAVVSGARTRGGGGGGGRSIANDTVLGVMPFTLEGGRGGGGELMYWLLCMFVKHRILLLFPFLYLEMGYSDHYDQRPSLL